MTLTFDDLSGLGDNGICIAENFSYGGFRFSPEAHADLNGGGFGGSRWLGWDGGCDRSNDNYLGTTSPFLRKSMYIDFFGRPFSLVSVFGPVAEGALIVRTSKGDYVDLCPDDCVAPSTFQFTGSPWRGIKWLEFMMPDPGAPVGIDQLTLRAVSEPGSLGLFAAGLLALGFLRRKRVV